MKTLEEQIVPAMVRTAGDPPAINEACGADAIISQASTGATKSVSIRRSGRTLLPPQIEPDPPESNDSVVVAGLRFIEEASPKHQIILGALSGCILGVMITKLGRAPLQIVGTSVVLMEVTNQNGLIQFTPWITKVTQFIESHTVFMSCFAGGLLIGLS